MSDKLLGIVSNLVQAVTEGHRLKTGHDVFEENTMRILSVECSVCFHLRGAVEALREELEPGFTKRHEGHPPLRESLLLLHSFVIDGGDRREISGKIQQILERL